MNTEGNDASRFPFSYTGPIRYQQVYDASQFSQVPAGGAFIARIFLRPDCTNGRSFLATNVQMNLSTTAKGPDLLSAAFPDNVGADNTVVYGPREYAAPAGAGGCPGTFRADDYSLLDIPFLYDPAKGNFLLDLKSAGIDTQGGGRLEDSMLDAQNLPGDSVSRAAAFSLTTNKAEVVDTMGLVTAFEIWSVPTITARYETNSLVLSWYFGWRESWQPRWFRLQWSDQAGPSAAWEDYPGDTGSDVHVYQRVVTVPISSLGMRKYFRLFWNTPQPLTAPPASPALQVEPIISP